MLERLVIHKNQFKGSSQYYTDYKKLDVEDMKDLLALEEKRGFVADKEFKVLEDLISDEALKALLSRKLTIEGNWNQFKVLEVSEDKNNILN